MVTGSGTAPNILADKKDGKVNKGIFDILVIETSCVLNHQHLMLLLDFYLRRFHHREEPENHFRHPLHIIVHHEPFVAWWQ